MSEQQILEKNIMDNENSIDPSALVQESLVAAINENNNGPEEESILKEILATPFIKDMLRTYLNGIKPETGNSFVKTLIWQDMEFLFSIIAALPSIVNSVINAINETGMQLNEKITPELLRGYMGDVFSDIDTETLKKGLSVYGELIKNQLENDNVKQSIMESLKNPVAEAIGRSINSSLVQINRIQDENPELIGSIIQRVSENIDNTEFKKTAMGIVNPALDRISYFKLIIHFIGSRISHRLNRLKRKNK